MPTARTRTAVLGAAAALALTACGGDTAGPEVGTTLGDVQADPAAYEGQEVRVSADVDEVLDPMAFTIAGTDDTSVDALLVVGAEASNNLEPDLTVAVEGTVRLAFDLTQVEDELGTDLDDASFEGRAGAPYLVAESIDTSVPSDQ